MIDPKQLAHELAMLYLRNQDLSGKTPSEISDLYQAAVAEIIKHRTGSWE